MGMVYVPHTRIDIRQSSHTDLFSLISIGLIRTSYIVIFRKHKNKEILQSNSQGSTHMLELVKVLVYPVWLVHPASPLGTNSARSSNFDKLAI